MTRNHSGRGRYDRTQSAHHRRRETRARIIQAAARALVAAESEPPNVRVVTHLAGVGRNTFYSHFRDGRDAQRATERVAAREIERVLDRDQPAAVTPIEKLRALANAWVECATRGTPCSDLAMSGFAGAAAPPAAALLERKLAIVIDAARAHGVVAGPTSERRISMVAAAWQRAAREVTAAHAEGTEVALDLVDLTLRAFR